MSEMKSKNFFASFIIGLLVISFAFTGYQSFQSSPDTIAKVGDTPIKVYEYQMELNRQIQFYKGLFGGKDLTTKDIERYKLKNTAVQSLIQRKLLLNLSEQLGTFASPLAIKQEIKNLPYFQTAEQFDINKYKALLRANGISPTDFEKDIQNGLKTGLIQTSIKDIPLSDDYLNDLKKFKSKTVKINAIKVEKASLKDKITVSKKEISNYLAVQQNLARVNATFKERKAELDRPAQIKARHILLQSNKSNDQEIKKKITKLSKKVTVANFAKMAKANTEDPSGKTNGGDLGWFGKNKMVPQFSDVAFKMNPGSISKPIKTPYGYHLIYVEKTRAAKMANFDTHKGEIATEQIKASKGSEVDKLFLKVASDAKKVIEKGERPLKRFAKEYNAAIETKRNVNLYDGLSSGVTLSNNELDAIFNLKNKKTHVFQNANSITLVKVLERSVSKISEEDLEKSQTQLKGALSRKLGEDLLKKLKENTKITINSKVL